jgi:ribosomal protein L34
MEKKREPKFYAKKRTKSGRYITIAEAATRQELIERIKLDSNTYREREREKNGKEVL